MLSANVKAVCPIEDHFNGTYTANCSLPNQCSTINVTLMFTNFSAYWRQDPDPLNKSLFVRRVCLNDSAISQEKLPEENYCKPEDVKLNETHLIYWLRSVKRNYSRSVWQLGSKGCYSSSCIREPCEKFCQSLSGTNSLLGHPIWVIPSSSILSSKHAAS